MPGWLQVTPRANERRKQAPCSWSACRSAANPRPCFGGAPGLRGVTCTGAQEAQLQPSHVGRGCLIIQAELLQAAMLAGTATRSCGGLLARLATGLGCQWLLKSLLRKCSHCAPEAGVLQEVCRPPFFTLAHSSTGTQRPAAALKCEVAYSNDHTCSLV